MKSWQRRIIGMFLAAAMIVLTACGNNTDGGDNASLTDNGKADQSFLHGLNFSDQQMSDRISVSQAAYLASALGAKSVRVCANCMETGTTFLDSSKKRLHELFSSLTLSGVEQVIFQIGPFPWEDVMGNKAPAPDPTDPGYTDFLTGIEKMAEMLATEFPEVTYWQLGNLFNYDRFLHPLGWKEENSPIEPFTITEKADITTDMMYHITKGIRSKKKDAVIIMPAMSAADGFGGPAMTDYLDRIYTNIKSGKHGSKTTEDFFDALAWHPLIESKPDQSFADNNKKIYAVAEKHGDKNRKVYLTEFGFDNKGDSSLDEQQAEWITEAYRLVKENMPYVESMHTYRMFNDGEEGYGLFNEPRKGFAPTAKGLAFQKMAGASSDLLKYVIKEDQYSSGDNVALSVPTKASSSCEHPGWGWSLSGVNNGTTENGGWSNYYEKGEADWITSPTGGGSNDFNKPEWVEFNLPFSWEINKVILYTRGEIDENFKQVMAVPHWTVVEVSDDGKNWKQVGELKLKDSDVKTYPDGVTYVDRSENPPLEISFNAVKTQNVRVTFKKLSPNWQHLENQYFVQLNEIEIIMK